jgi:hypothetical protein
MSLSTNSTIPASLLPSSNLSLVQNTRINYKWQWYGGRTVRGLSIVLMARNRTQVASEVHSFNALTISMSKLASIECATLQVRPFICTSSVPPYSSFFGYSSVLRGIQMVILRF